MTDLTFDPTRCDVQRDPYPHFRRLRDSAPVYWIEPLQAFGLGALNWSVEWFHPGGATPEEIADHLIALALVLGDRDGTI